MMATLSEEQERQIGFNLIHHFTYLTAEGPDRSKTGGGPFALKAFNVFNVLYSELSLIQRSSCQLFYLQFLFLGSPSFNCPSSEHDLEEIFSEETEEKDKSLTNQ